MRELLEGLARELVSRPEEVTVRELDSRDGVRLELRVAPEDIGRVIGRGGRTARALRTVVRAAATIIAVVSIAIESRSEACTVTGTTRSIGLASIMICWPEAPVSAARNSVWPG